MDENVNDDVMDSIRSKYEVLDRIIKHPAYEDSAVKAEAWQAFQEIRRLRIALDEAQLSSIEGWNPGIDMDEVRRFRAGHKK